MSVATFCLTFSGESVADMQEDPPWCVFVQGGQTEPEDGRTLIQRLWGQFNQTNANTGECLRVQHQRGVKNSPAGLRDKLLYAGSH